jgi:hypothetical protein
MDDERDVVNSYIINKIYPTEMFRRRGFDSTGNRR